MPDTQPTPAQPAMPTYAPMPRPPMYPPPMYYPPPGYYPPPQYMSPPGYPQPYPSGKRPVRENIKVAALICWGFAVIVAVAGGASTLIIAGLLNIAVFVLIFFI